MSVSKGGRDMSVSKGGRDMEKWSCGVDRAELI